MATKMAVAYSLDLSGIETYQVQVSNTKSPTLLLLSRFPACLILSSVPHVVDRRCRQKQSPFSRWPSPPPLVRSFMACADRESKGANRATLSGLCRQHVHDPREPTEAYECFKLQPQNKSGLPQGVGCPLRECRLHSWLRRWLA